MMVWGSNQFIYGFYEFIFILALTLILMNMQIIQIQSWESNYELQ